MWRSLEPFKQDVEVHEPSKDNTEAVGKILGVFRSSNTRNHWWT
jgi:hypothetical protein